MAEGEWVNKSLLADALRDLAGTVCAVCGRRKLRGKSFCRDCYHRLPANLRAGLYRLVSEGYATAYDEARDWLRVNR